jgi:hypothetical protein
MTPENFRRAQLGLSVHGPFSRNRRRPLSHHAAFLASGLLLFLLLFLTALFS